MSHHYSGPDFGFPHGDARLDMTDLYAFPKPGESDKSILVLNVHPSVAVNPPGPTTKEPFAPGALYEFKVETDRDAAPDSRRPSRRGVRRGRSYRRGSTGLSRAGSPGDENRRLPFFLWL